jgi:dihydrofolate synthase/folylpolyglutamate synthase
VPGHEHHAPAALTRIARELGLGAAAAGSVEEALGAIARQADPARPPVVLIVGSLYLAGDVLRRNLQPPT